MDKTLNTQKPALVATAVGMALALLASPLAIKAADASTEPLMFCIGSQYGEERFTGMHGGSLCDAKPAPMTIKSLPLPAGCLPILWGSTVMVDGVRSPGARLTWTLATDRAPKTMSFEYGQVKDGQVVAVAPTDRITTVAKGESFETQFLQPTAKQLQAGSGHWAVRVVDGSRVSNWLSLDATWSSALAGGGGTCAPRTI